jgi:hypothetical protein
MPKSSHKVKSLTLEDQTAEEIQMFLSLCDSEVIEHPDFEKIQNISKDHCRYEYSYHNKYR